MTLSQHIQIACALLKHTFNFSALFPCSYLVLDLRARACVCATQTNLAYNGFDADFQLLSARRNSYSGTGLRNDLTYLMGYTANSLFSAKRNSLVQPETNGTLFAHKLSTELKRKEKEVEVAKTESERLKIVVADMQKENKKLRNQARVDKNNYERRLSQVGHHLVDSLTDPPGLIALVL